MARVIFVVNALVGSLLSNCLTGQTTNDTKMPTYKLQVQEDDTNATLWHDVNSATGSPLLFQDETIARAKLEELFPVLVKLERFASGPKRTRVIIVNPYQDIDAEKEK